MKRILVMAMAAFMVAGAHAGKKKEPVRIPFQPGEINVLLGTDISAEEMLEAGAAYEDVVSLGGFVK